jgi:hypothetical protein
MTPATLPHDLRTLILTLARRKDVHSVSCQFQDRALWKGLLVEQVRRARATGRPPREAFFLCGPDGGIPGIAKLHPGLDDDYDGSPPRFNGDTLEEQMGGAVHIPYEGVCGADLLVYPAWRRLYPLRWQQAGAELDWITVDKPCNHLLTDRDLGEAPNATRTGPVAGSWWLYSSTAPYKDCNPFRPNQTRADRIKLALQFVELLSASRVEDEPAGPKP